MRTGKLMSRRQQLLSASERIYKACPESKDTKVIKKF
jgi:hypothetical protein